MAKKMKQGNQIKHHFKEGNTVNKRNTVSKSDTLEEGSTMNKENAVSSTMSKDNAMDELDLALESMAKEMDEDFMRIGKEIADLYRTICVAAASLPNMCLRTELMEVHNSDDGLMVVFHRDAAEAGRQNNEKNETDGYGCCGGCGDYGDYGDNDDYDGHYGCDDDYDADEDFYDDYDEEEDLLYDGD